MFRQFVRSFATRNLPGKTGKPESTALIDPVRQVFISQSNDVFTNLALEDWLYRHHDFAHKVRFAEIFTIFMNPVLEYFLSIL